MQAESISSTDALSAYADFPVTIHTVDSIADFPVTIHAVDPIVDFVSSCMSTVDLPFGSANGLYDSIIVADRQGITWETSPHDAQAENPTEGVNLPKLKPFRRQVKTERRRARRSVSVPSLPAVPRGNCGQQLPSVPRMAANMAKHAAKHVLTGAKQASPELVEARLAACKVCRHRTMVAHCAKCGCVIEALARWESSKCKAKKWPEPESVTAGRE